MPADEWKPNSSAQERKSVVTMWFVSRHAGAVAWARRQGFHVDRWVPHLVVSDIRAGDVVAGNLPIQMAAQICAKGAHYLNLSIDLPAALRGHELDVAHLERHGARLERFHVCRSTEEKPE